MTGYEVIPFGGGISAYGFGWLERNGYLTLPTSEEYRGWSQEVRWDWVVETLAHLNAVAQEAESE